MREQTLWEPVAAPSGIQPKKCFLIKTVRHLLRAQLRVKLNHKRTRKSAIFTVTPEKHALEARKRKIPRFVRRIKKTRKIYKVKETERVQEKPLKRGNKREGYE